MEPFLARVKSDEFLSKSEKREKRINGIKTGIYLFPKCRCNTILTGRYKKIGLCASCYKLHQDNNQNTIDKLSRIITDLELELQLKKSVIANKDRYLSLLNSECTQKDNTIDCLNRKIHHLQTNVQLKVNLDTIEFTYLKESKTCVICLDQIEVIDKIYDIFCGHSYHTHCLVRIALNNEKCPICRHDIC